MSAGAGAGGLEENEPLDGLVHVIIVGGGGIERRDTPKSRTQLVIVYTMGYDVLRATQPGDAAYQGLDDHLPLPDIQQQAVSARDGASDACGQPRERHRRELSGSAWVYHSVQWTWTTRKRQWKGRAYELMFTQESPSVGDIEGLIFASNSGEKDRNDDLPQPPPPKKMTTTSYHTSIHAGRHTTTSTTHTSTSTRYCMTPTSSGSSSHRARASHPSASASTTPSPSAPPSATDNILHFREAMPAQVTPGQKPLRRRNTIPACSIAQPYANANFHSFYIDLCKATFVPSGVPSSFQASSSSTTPGSTYSLARRVDSTLGVAVFLKIHHDLRGFQDYYCELLSKRLCLLQDRVWYENSKDERWRRRVFPVLILG
ncbi:hypothetical protein B0H19DRAFT_1072022 [Mycena capillaripes]|nr:hypothetical protein B0H19DRAFT_1072022 [Mycena capillaripes]